MLNIPNSIKTLFKTDGTRKNFRVQFPNGELPDITNENIVRESVHFTESICSQSTFRFGLAEASVIEFETVGIPNMYGYTISCSYEIDTSSLSASEISSIQSDPGDGELVLASASDIGYGFYRVPLGVFRVEKCPRNHGAMTHRQVTGYTTTNHPGAYAEFENLRLSLGRKFDRCVTSSGALRYSMIAYSNPELIASELTPTAIPYSSMSGSEHVATSQLISWTVGDDVYAISVTATYKTHYLWNSALSLFTFGFDPGGLDSLGVWEKAKAWAVQYGLTPALMTSNYLTIEQALVGNVGQVTGVPLIPRVSFLYSHTGSFTQDVSTRDATPLLGTINIASVPIDSETYRSVEFYIPKSVTLRVTKNGSNVESYRTTATTDPVLTQYVGGSIGTLIEYQPSSVEKSPNGTIDWHYYIGVDFDAIFTGFQEVAGQFAKDNRNGGIEELTLSPSSPLSISPGDYDEVWWDEYDVSPIGTVTVTYRNGEEGEATANVTLGAGASLYDMTDNEVLKNLSTADLDSITTLLSGDFATNAQNVGFTPIEMTMQGWPWLEAGDALQITAEDGTVVNTYALRVEMSGIQHLMSDITADGGEIIGEV